VQSARTIEAWRPTDPAWHAEGQLTAARSRSAAVVLDDGRVLLVGGNRQDRRGELWTLGETTTRLTGPMSMAAEGYRAVKLGDGRVLAVGLRSVEIYDPITNQWTVSAGTPRLYPSLTLLSDGTVAVIGGLGLRPNEDAPHDLGSAERFNPSQNRWDSLPPLRLARAFHGAAQWVDGSVVVVGGIVGGVAAIGDVEVLDLKTRRWSQGPSLDQSRDGEVSRTQACSSPSVRCVSRSCNAGLRPTPAGGKVQGLHISRSSICSFSFPMGPSWRSVSMAIASRCSSGWTHLVRVACGERYFVERSSCNKLSTASR